jgi:hypothetical protein
LKNTSKINYTSTYLELKILIEEKKWVNIEKYVENKLHIK